MRVVTAYVDLPKGELPPYDGGQPVQWGEYVGNTPEGLQVEWGVEPPEASQVYLYWEPRVVAIWDEEEIEDEYGIEVEQSGQGDSEEADGGTGQGGEGAGEGQAPSPEKPVAVE